MSYVVLKFGGTSVSNRQRWQTIASVVQQRLDSGFKVLVVCSAASGITNALERLLTEAVTGDHEATLDHIKRRHHELADELGVSFDSVLADHFKTLERLVLGASLTGEVSARLRARVLAMGELMLTRLGAEFLRTAGMHTRWLDAREWLRSVPVPQESEARHFLSATCDYSLDAALLADLNDGPAVSVTQGFIAYDTNHETVLLGRGGSDTSGAYFAAKLAAFRLEIWTDVPGMYTANPREVASARLLKRLHYDEAQEIASMGAKVLHPRCLAPVREYQIPLHICCTELPDVQGTVISGDSPDFGAQVKAISSKTGVLLVSMDTLGMWQQVGFLADAFQCFKRHGLSIDLVTTSESNVTVSLDPAANVLDPATRAALLRDLGQFCNAKTIGPTAAVSLVGHNIRAILHQLGPALEVFGEQQVYLVSQAASDLNLTFVVDEDQAPRLVQKLHELLFHDRFSDPLLGPTWGALFRDEREAQVVDAKTWWVERREELLERAAHGRPLYVYDLPTIRRRCQDVLSLGVDHVFFAIKANPHTDVLHEIQQAGIGFECVSPGELDHVRRLFKDLPPEKTLFTPNFAPRHEYQHGIESGAFVTVDSLYILEHWPELFQGRRVMLRIDPGHGRGHHKKVKTAGTQAKFGIPPERMPRLLELIRELSLDVYGLHSHVGSGIKYAQTWAETAVFLASIADQIGGVRVLNVGGGLGVVEKPGQKRLNLDDVRNSIAQFRNARPEFELWMEPGRFLVAEAGALIAQVTQVKEKGEGRFYVGLSTGMNSLIRPALYGAHHQIVNLTRLGEPVAMVADVVGPICETGDVLGHKRRLPRSEEGDVFLVATAGAYGHVMGSNYNLRGIASEEVLR